MLAATSSAAMPRPEVAFAWGSQSTSRTRWPRSGRAAPRLMVVVVLPTPPFWLATAMILVGTTIDYARRTAGGGAGGAGAGRGCFTGNLTVKQLRCEERFTGILTVKQLSDLEAGFLLGLLGGEGHFGGDARQPQVTLRMHTRHEALFRWLERTRPGSTL